MILSTRDAFRVVDQFEAALAEYTGAPHVVTTDCGTHAILLALTRWRQHFPDEHFVRCPKYTYAGVARAAMNAGLEVRFVDLEWRHTGMYYLWPSRVLDSARFLSRGMYEKQNGSYMCLSFQATKHLPIGRGGAILCDNESDAEWFRRARFDGRRLDVGLWAQSSFDWGIHAYLPPDAAARGLWLMNGLKDVNEPLPAEYPDLSTKEWRDARVSRP